MKKPPNFIWHNILSMVKQKLLPFYPECIHNDLKFSIIRENNYVYTISVEIPSARWLGVPTFQHWKWDNWERKFI